MEAISADRNFIHFSNNKNVYNEPIAVKEGNATLHYKPKTIISRYVIGEPVAFTDQPILPIHFQHQAPPNPITSPFPGVQTISQHIPSNINATLSKSIYRNIDHDSVIESRKRTVSYDNKLSSPSAIRNNFDEQTAYVRKQTFDKILQQNTQLRNQNSKLVEENKKLRQLSISYSNKKNIYSEYQDTQITELQRTINQLNLEIQSLKLQRNIDSKRNTDMSINLNKNEQLNQKKNEQIIYDVFNSCIEKYRMSILQEQKLLIDRYRLECKNDELNQKKLKLEESRRQQLRPKSSSYHQPISQKPKIQSSIMKQNWANIIQNESHHHHKHWRKNKN